MLRVSTVLSLFIAVLISTGCSSSRTGSHSSAGAPDSVVAIFDQNAFSVSQFESEYARSVGSIETAAADSMPEYVDFLERYVNYRIKVLEGKESGLESDSAIVAELASYRTQYAKPYLINQKVLDPIILDLFQRSQDMVEASHILLRTTTDQSPADTLALYNKLSAIRDSVAMGVQFGDLAIRHSEDPSAKESSSPLGYRGYLGYFSSGSMVAQFEDWAYRTTVGEISPVFRTRYGYHILTVTDRKPTPGDVAISHIMITPKGSTAADSAIAKVVVDSLYAQSLRGDDFAVMARSFSDDKQSSAKGGSLGTVSYTSRFLPELKNVAFALPEVGAVSTPIQTRFGYHLIRLDETFERKTLDESYEELKTAAARTPRATLGELAFADSVLAAANVTVDSTQVFSILADLLPDSLAALAGSTNIPQAGVVVATLGSSQFTLGDFVNTATWRRYRAALNKSAKELQRTALRDYMRDRAIDHEVSALEKNDSEFKRTMNEFRNGILLFRLMEDSVWTAAAKDTMALQAEYNKDPSRFNYTDRTRLVTYFSTNKAPLGIVLAGLEAKSIDTVPDSIMSAIRVDTTLLSGQSNSIYDRGLEQPVGGNTGILAYNSGSIIIVNDGIDAARAKTFDEARAELINIVQEAREEALVSRLRVKFDVSTFPSHLIGAFSGANQMNE